MKLITGVSFRQFADEIKHQNRHIICYGAGLVAMATEHIFQEEHIAERVCCFIDRDVSKHGTSIRYDGRSIKIFNIDDLLCMDLTDKVLLISLEVFGAVLDALDGYVELAGLPCYIFTEINKSYIAEKGVHVEGKPTGEQEIPKIIHYAWLGGGIMKEDVLRCIDSWKTYCPRYEFVCWTEDNYDVFQNRYMRESYEAGQYAFTADFLRLDVLYKHGGVYLDVDVELLRSLDDFLCNRAFAVYLEWAMPTFAVSGCVAGTPIFREMRDEPRANMSFFDETGRFNQKISSYYEVEILSRYGFRKNFSPQTIAGMRMYPPSAVATNGRLGANAPITSDTYAVHYCYRSWAGQNRQEEIDKTTIYAKKMWIKKKC